MKTSILHRLAHVFGLFRGRVVTVHINDSKDYLIGFQCATCGDIGGLCKPVLPALDRLDEVNRAYGGAFKKPEPPLP